MASLKITKLPGNISKSPPDHWVGNPPTHFQNPWPSFGPKLSLPKIIQTRFGRSRNFVPVPEDRQGLVAIQTPDWGTGKQGIKATWIGHSSFLIDMPTNSADAPESRHADDGQSPLDDETTRTMPKPEPSDACTPRISSRGIRFLMDPVFSEKMGPAGIVGPRRFTPTPCQLDDLPLVDAICISHNHYDHLDVDVIKHLASERDQQRRIDAGMAPLHIFCGLGSKAWFVGCNVRAENITEMDWWDEVEVHVTGITGSVRAVCTPSQHGSQRGPWDKNQMLWCSFVLRGAAANSTAEPSSVFFAGDTGYCSVTDDNFEADASAPEDRPPHCPAFAGIGERYGPLSLALLPIGCYTPRSFMSGVHCAPEDAVAIHFDVRSRLSVGMHYGTVRGGISAHYEDVREPPKRWRAAGEKRGLVWDRDFRVCSIGETVVV